ncbi:MAG: TatD family hydrolase [Muribaculaceae bacterium]|nr:TatD family hydrolase [Muribaculaceae bacterium]
MILDFHTHNQQATDALICVEPQNFDPQPGKLYSAGIHPWHSENVTSETLEALHAAARHPQVVAIGETGLDALRGAPLEAQQSLFQEHIRLAEQLGKPLIIHMVRTSQQILKAWHESQRSVPWVIHGMRGNPRVAQPLIDAGFYLSFGPRFNPATVTATPLDRLLIETDDDTAATIHEVAQAVAQARGIDTQQLIDAVTQNITSILSL